LGTPARAANFPQRNRLIAGLVSGVVIVEAAMRSGSLITARLANEMGRDIFALPGSIHAPLSRGCHRIIKQGAKLVETPDEVLEELGFVKPAAGRVAATRTALWDGADSRNPPRASTRAAVVQDAAAARANSTDATDLAARAAVAEMPKVPKVTEAAKAEATEAAETQPSTAAPPDFADPQAVARAPANLPPGQACTSPSPTFTKEAQQLLAALGHAPATLEILATRTEMEDAALQTTLLQLELAGQVTVLPGGRFMRASHGRPRSAQG
ncbi:MAG TPA: DNA-processing protein DprA, partial [Paraburkholderia sp.]|nr:DNA-processing protein DprA [Paraburkholderia sp.]